MDDNNGDELQNICHSNSNTLLTTTTTIPTSGTDKINDNSSHPPVDSTTTSTDSSSSYQIDKRKNNTNNSRKRPIKYRATKRPESERRFQCDQCESRCFCFFELNLIFSFKVDFLPKKMSNDIWLYILVFEIFHVHSVNKGLVEKIIQCDMRKKVMIKTHDRVNDEIQPQPVTITMFKPKHRQHQRHHRRL